MTGPYSVSAQDYFDEGWSPVPFPFKTKWPPPDGFTGAKGAYVDAKQLKAWLNPRGRASAGNMTWKSCEGNIGLRLPSNIIGIDVDMYDGKAGRETFNKAIDAWGPLPPTWSASSRRDGSGIRLFKVPPGLAWPGKLPQGGGVELIRPDHRYVICAPSIHPDTGEPYMWFKFGELVDDEIPNVDEIPDLPQAWIDGLTGGKVWTERTSVDMDDEAVRTWLAERNDGEPCSAMRRTLTTYLRHVRVAGDDGGAHDAARDGAWALIGDAHAGHSGVLVALGKLRKAFTNAVAARRGTDGERLAREEWARIVVRGVRKVAAEGESEEDDLCALLGARSAVQSSGSGSGGDGGDSGGNEQASAQRVGKLWDYSRTDDGNAERLYHKHRHEMRYCPALGGWHVWDVRRWVQDVEDAQVWRWCKDITHDMESEAQEIDDPKQLSAFMKWIKDTRMNARRRAMIEGATKLPDIMVSAAYFDSRPDYLGCMNGLVRLKDSGPVERVPPQPEHRLMLLAGAEYDPDVRSDLWEEFMNRIQPDEDTREWLQRLVGYTLWGGNPERLFIVCKGPTSTGKTTFAEALRVALGDYAAVTNMTVFRDNQDERQRTDLVEALPRRFLYAEEASYEWHLHPDQIKRLTGGSMVKARRSHGKEYIERVPAFTPWLFTNATPNIENADDAFMRRLVVVPFAAQIPKAEEVSEYRNRLCSEARAAVLSWAVRGWEMYRANPDLEPPANAFLAKEEVRRELSEFDVMLREVCDLDQSYQECTRALYQAYERWCATSGVRGNHVLKAVAFGRALTVRGIGKGAVWQEGKTVKTRIGLRLNDGYRILVPEALER